jgi:chaperonin GroES
VAAQVLAVGPGRTDEEGKATAPAVKVGSTVLYQKYSGTEFEGDSGKQYIVIREGDVLAALA